MLINTSPTRPDERLSIESADPADSDMLILVDEGDREVGHLGKRLCHQDGGVRHRAFSLLIFDDRGRLLLQQRAPGKRLWPGYWSNSCCSHPRQAESMEVAIHRRLYEELGLRCPLHFLFKFEYRAQFDATGAEHELCSVYVGRCADPVRVNCDEVMDWRWIDIPALEAELGGVGAERFTPWFKLEWARIRRDYAAQIQAL